MGKREPLSTSGIGWVYYFGSMLAGGLVGFFLDWRWWGAGVLALLTYVTCEGLDALVRFIWLKRKTSSPAEGVGEEDPC